MSYVCKICGNSHNNIRSLTLHNKKKHKIEHVRNYMVENYPELFEPCHSCNTPTKNYKDSTNKKKKYFCSMSCHGTYKKGKQQSKETVEKRIKNTDQISKEAKRQRTMLLKYGELFLISEQQIQQRINSQIGHKKSEEHIRKIIESKRLSGKINHSIESRNKISESLRKYHRNPNIDHHQHIHNNSGGRGYLTGSLSGIFYRSSYELKFLQLCEKHNVKAESAATKEYRLIYHDTAGVRRYYYPDFILVEYGVVVEIKPASLIDTFNNMMKIETAASKYNFWLVCEEELEEFEFLQGVNGFEHISLT